METIYVKLIYTHGFLQYSSLQPRSSKVGIFGDVCEKELLKSAIEEAKDQKLYPGEIRKLANLNSLRRCEIAAKILNNECHNGHYYCLQEAVDRHRDLTDLFFFRHSP